MRANPQRSALVLSCLERGGREKKYRARVPLVTEPLSAMALGESGSVFISMSVFFLRRRCLFQFPSVIFGIQQPPEFFGKVRRIIAYAF